MVDCNLQVAIIEKEKLDEVYLRIEEAIKSHEEKRKEVNERDNLIWKLRKQLGKMAKIQRQQRAPITSSRAPAPLSGPIIEIPGTPRSPEYYTNEELEEEKNKLKVAQIDVVMKFENKLRDTIMYLIDRVEWLTFYMELSKFAGILNKLSEK